MPSELLRTLLFSSCGSISTCWLWIVYPRKEARGRGRGGARGKQGGKLKVELFEMLNNPRRMIAGEVDFPFEKRII